MAIISWATFFAAILLASPATSHALFKREEGSYCPSGTRHKPCFEYYTTGSKQCSSGYTRYELVAKGDPPGSYCERRCTGDILKQCEAEQCQDNIKDCEKNQSVHNCDIAVTKCGGAKTTAELCDRDKFRYPVKYDQKTGICKSDPEGTKTYQVSYTFMAQDAPYLRVFSCGRVTQAGVDSLDAAVKKFGKDATCKYFKQSRLTKDFIIRDCKAEQGVWGRLETAIGAACKIAAHDTVKDPEFSAYDDDGRL